MNDGHDEETCPAALDIAIALTALQFNKHDRRAAALLVPYLAWCAFAPTCKWCTATFDAVALGTAWQHKGQCSKARSAGTLSRAVHPVRQTAPVASSTLIPCPEKWLLLES